MEALRGAPDALRVALGIVASAREAQENPKHRHPHSEMHTRWAVDTVLDRALGKAEQAIHMTGEALTTGLPAEDAAMLVSAIRAEIARRARLDAAIEAESTTIATPQTPEKP